MIIGIVVAVTVFIVKLSEAARKITVNYAKRVQGNRSYGGVTTILPVKLITAGVIPIIFAVAFLSVPQFAGQLMTGMSNPKYQSLGTKLVSLFQNPSVESFSCWRLAAISLSNCIFCVSRYLYLFLYWHRL